MRTGLGAAVLLAILLGGCLGRSPRPADTATVLPATAAPSPLPPATLVPTALPTPAATLVPLAAPAVLDRYPLASGMLGESLAAGPGRVWVGTTFGTIEERDASSGALLHTFTLVDSSPEFPSPVKALAFDGQQLWALVDSTSQDQLTTRLFVLQPGTGKVIQLFDVTAYDPGSLGQSPGQIWTQGQVYRSDTRRPSPLALNTTATIFAYDGASEVWAGGGTTCDHCPTYIYRYRASDLTLQGPGPSKSQLIQALAPAGRRMWAATGYNHLDGYDLTAAQGADTPPVASVDLSPEMQIPPHALAFDGRSLWLLPGPGKGGGSIYQHDPQTGQMISALKVGDEGGSDLQQARIPTALAFDGRDLWVLTAYDLVRVGLPWTRQINKP